jgi:hypothetical protein
VNYSELSSLVQDYCETREATFVANIPVFVRQAEQRIYRVLGMPELRKEVTLSTTSGVPILDRPADFIAPISLAVVGAGGLRTFLLDKDVSFVREAYPSGTLGTPKYYAQLDGRSTGSPGRFILGPTPNAVYDIEVQYVYDPESIVTAGTTWLGDMAETALLYGTIVEGYVYLKGESSDMAAQYKARYEEALQMLSGVDVRSRRDDYRDGQVGRG